VNNAAAPLPCRRHPSNPEWIDRNVIRNALIGLNVSLHRVNRMEGHDREEHFEDRFRQHSRARTLVMG
jgi:hypothetical protein